MRPDRSLERLRIHGFELGEVMGSKRSRTLREILEHPIEHGRISGLEPGIHLVIGLKSRLSLRNSLNATGGLDNRLRFSRSLWRVECAFPSRCLAEMRVRKLL